jgi:hypothetical protein
MVDHGAHDDDTGDSDPPALNRISQLVFLHAHHNKIRQQSYSFWHACLMILKWTPLPHDQTANAQDAKVSNTKRNLNAESAPFGKYLLN